MRDEGALASAIMRPQLGYYDSLIEEAAALLESLANNHPFVDGNKRTAVAVTDTFLRLNGHYIDCDNEEASVISWNCSEGIRFALPSCFRGWRGMSDRSGAE